MFSLSDCFIFLLVCRCSTLLIVGDNSPAVEAVVDCNSKLNPTKTTLLKVTGELVDSKINTRAISDVFYLKLWC